MLLEKAGGLSQSVQHEQAPRDAVTQEPGQDAAEVAAAQSGDGPSTWHQNDLSSEVDWSLNPLAVGMDPADFFDSGYGELADLEMLTLSAEGSPSPRLRKGGRKPILSVSIPEPEETFEVTKRIVTPVMLLRPSSPLLSLTPSQVNARTPFPPSPLKTTSLAAREAPCDDWVEGMLGSTGGHRDMDPVEPQEKTTGRSTRQPPRSSLPLPTPRSHSVGGAAAVAASRKRRECWRSRQRPPRNTWHGRIGIGAEPRPHR